MGGAPPAEPDPGVPIPDLGADYDEDAGADASYEPIEDCEEEAERLGAELTFEPRRQMTVGQTYNVQATLTLGDLPPSVTFETPTTVVEISGRCEFEAALTGADFAITPDDPQEASFMDSPSVVWLWDVRPKHAGDNQELDLRIQARLFGGGRTLPGELMLNQSVIDVDAADRSVWRRFTDWSSNVFPEAVGAVVVAAGGGVVAMMKRVRTKRAAGAMEGVSSTKPGSNASGDPT